MHHYSNKKILIVSLSLAMVCMSAICTTYASQTKAESRTEEVVSGKKKTESMNSEPNATEEAGITGTEEEEGQTIVPEEGYQVVSYLYETIESSDILAAGNAAAMVIGILEEGQMITITEVNDNNYGKFAFEDGAGWISLENCELVCTNVSATAGGEDDSDPYANEGCDVIPDESSFSGILTTNKTKKSTGYVANESLVIRSGPGTGYEQLGCVTQDNFFSVTETSNGWGKADFDGTEGWVYLGNCTKTASSTISVNTDNCGWKENEGIWEFRNKDEILFRSNTMHMAWEKIKDRSSETCYYAAVDCNSNETFIFIGESGKWIPYKLFICSTGKESTPTTMGTFTVSDRGYSFSQENYTCYYYTRFSGNYLFHTIEYQTDTFNELDGRLGENISQGCVRLQIDDAKWIYENLTPGTAVVTYDEQL